MNPMLGRWRSAIGSYMESTIDPHSDLLPPNMLISIDKLYC